jgi:two-component system OmpR family sensor kinase
VREEGIPAEHLPRVFDRFYKVDLARTDRSSGSGLGLSITKAIIERHGGAISVTSRPGETMFDVELPLPDRKAMPEENPDAAEVFAGGPQTLAWPHARRMAQG